MKKWLLVLILSALSMAAAFAGGPTPATPEISATPSFTSVDSLVYKIGGYDALTATGTNTFAGGCGNSTVTGVYNFGLGTPNPAAPLVTKPLGALTTGSNNLAIGYYSSLNLTSGSGNITIGPGSGQSITSGDFNTLLGYEAGLGVGGSRNFAVGLQAIRNSSGANNTMALGYQAGLLTSTGSLSTITDGILFGRATKTLADSSVNEIVIGAEAIGAGNNTVTLGSDSVTLTKLKGNVEIPGFTKLGDVATGVKMKVLTGTTSAVAGSDTTAAHGLTGAKILAMNVLVAFEDNTRVVPGVGGGAAAGIDYAAYFNSTNIVILTSATDGSQLLGKSFKVVLWYTE